MCNLRSVAGPRNHVKIKNYQRPAFAGKRDMYLFHSTSMDSWWKSFLDGAN